MEQLQERLYLRLKKYEDEFNICHCQARTPSQADYCGDQLISRINNDMMKYLKDVVDEY